jgi:hypothetical protein
MYFHSHIPKASFARPTKTDRAMLFEENAFTKNWRCAENISLLDENIWQQGIPLLPLTSNRHVNSF